MRFAKLRLAAFLSFKDSTEIDFAQFGNQLILLFGGSGVGKTAIFDGITFALYGRGSGKDRCLHTVNMPQGNIIKSSKGCVIHLSAIAIGCAR